MTAASKRLEQEPVAESDEEWIIRQDFLFIDRNPSLRSVRLRLAKLSAARSLVTEDPDILDRF